MSCPMNWAAAGIPINWDARMQGGPINRTALCNPMNEVASMGLPPHFEGGSQFKLGGTPSD